MQGGYLCRVQVVEPAGHVGISQAVERIYRQAKGRCWDAVDAVVQHAWPAWLVSLTA